MAEEIPLSFGQWLKERRQAFGYTQKELASLVGCSVETIRKFEAGQRRPSKQVSDLLARHLEIAEHDRQAFLQFSREQPVPLALPDLPPVPGPTPVPQAASDAPATTEVAQPPPTNLPNPLAAFIGRDDEIDSICAILGLPDVRLLTLTGPPGVGKTRLSIQAASTMLGSFPDGVFFVPLASVAEPDLVFPAIARVLEVPEPADVTVLESLKGHLRDTAALLVLDNLEQVADAGPGLADLLSAARRLKVLATSRVPLHVYGEQEFPVPPLELPPAEAADLESLGDYESVQLFVRRAQSARPTFRLDRDNAQAIAEIARRLDGLPLALELAAARIKLWDPNSLLTRLSSRMELLSGGARDLPARQQTLRAALAWSYNLLSPEEQQVFRRMSVFPSGCTLDAMQRISDEHGGTIDVAQIAASLVDQSLIAAPAGEGGGRFTMLETVREYGLEQLEAAGEGDQTRNTLAAHCLALAEEAEPYLAGAEQGRWLAALEEEHDNLAAALEWLLSAGDDSGKLQTALRIASTLMRFWDLHGHLTEGRRWLTEGLGKSEGMDIPPVVKADATSAAGWLAYEQGDHSTSKVLNQQSLALRREIGDPATIAISLNNLANCYLPEGDYASAQELFEQSLALRRQIGDTKGVAQTLNNLGTLAGLQADNAAAMALFEESLSLWRELGDKDAVSALLNNLGTATIYEGDFAKARGLLEEGLSLAEELGDKLTVAYSLANLGYAACGLDDYKSCRRYYRRSLSMLWDMADRRVIPDCVEGLARASVGLGEYERATRLLGASAALRERLGVPLSPVDMPSYDETLGRVREHLTADQFDDAWAEGALLQLPDLVDYALEKHAATSD